MLTGKATICSVNFQVCSVCVGEGVCVCVCVWRLRSLHNLPTGPKFIMNNFQVIATEEPVKVKTEAMKEPAKVMS